MAVILGYIDGSLVGYTSAGSDFLALVQETLGNAGDTSDGWDADMAAVLSLFPTTDAGVSALDLTFNELAGAVDVFNSLDTTSPFLDFPAQLPALSLLPGAGQLAQVAPVSLPGLPPPPGSQPPAPPPVTCIPAPQPTPAPPTPAPPPQLPPAQPPCPQGWAFVSGKCQPPAQPAPGAPGLPPILLPPLPAGLPPCPPSGFLGPGVPCKSMAGAPADDASFVMKAGALTLSEITAGHVTAMATAWATAGLPLTMTVIPVVGAVIAVAALLWSILGGGCGEACIDASKVEQVYEAVADNLFLIARAGMIASAEAVLMMEHFREVGRETEDRLGTTASHMGFINLSKVIDAEVAAAKLLSNTPTVPLTLAAARALYVGGAGWYPDSIALASRLTDQFVSGYIQGTRG